MPITGTCEGFLSKRLTRSCQHVEHLACLLLRFTPIPPCGVCVMGRSSYTVAQQCRSRHASFLTPLRRSIGSCDEVLGTDSRRSVEYGSILSRQSLAVHPTLATTMRTKSTVAPYKAKSSTNSAPPVPRCRRNAHRSLRRVTDKNKCHTDKDARNESDEDKCTSTTRFVLEQSKDHDTSTKGKTGSTDTVPNDLSTQISSTLFTSPPSTVPESEATISSGVTAAELPIAELAVRVAAQLSLAVRPTRYVLEQVRRHSATVPFLARYRRDETGQLDEDGIRRVLTTAEELAEVHRRRQFMLKSLTQRQLLTAELQAVLGQCTDLAALEDIWEFYKERKTSLAARGREAGLGEWARTLTQSTAALPRDAIDTITQLPDGERLFAAIVVEEVQRCSELREALLACCNQSARITSTLVTAARKKVAKEMTEDAWDKVQKNFSFYDGKSWPVRHIESHVLLALLRGERKGVLRLEMIPAPPSRRYFEKYIRQHFCGLAARMSAVTSATDSRCGGGSTTSGTNRNARSSTSSSTNNAPSSSSFTNSRVCNTCSPYSKKELDCSQQCLNAAFAQLLKSVHTTALRQLRKNAEEDARGVFAHNLRHMLLQRPLAQARILAMDPGLRNGVKCVALDEQGAVLHCMVCTLMNETAMRARVREALCIHNLNKVVIGNGTASQKTTELIAELVQLDELRHVEFTVVSEAGASVYSVSDIAKAEFPSLDAMYRGAISIGRRVLDPLSEYVKIPVRSMGIGMYQHDMNEKDLMRTLSDVVESCVAHVGVNAESVNRYVVEKVPGVSVRLADQIVLARHARALNSREDLRRVPGMTESMFTHVAGFFRFPNSNEPLDNSFIHPESYGVVRRLLAMRQCGELGERAKLITHVTPMSPALASQSQKGPLIEAQITQSNTENRATSLASMAVACSSNPDIAIFGGAARAGPLSCTVEQRVELGRALAQMSNEALTTLAHSTLQCGVHALRFIAEELQHPGLDPRATLPHAGLLRRTLLKESELKRGDRLTGLVLSVTPFGSFVDCGLHRAVLVRCAPTTQMQVGQLIENQLVFHDLDHLGRPRVVYDDCTIKKYDDNHDHDDGQTRNNNNNNNNHGIAKGDNNSPLHGAHVTHDQLASQLQESTDSTRRNNYEDSAIRQNIGLDFARDIRISTTGFRVGKEEAHHKRVRANADSSSPKEYMEKKFTLRDATIQHVSKEIATVPSQVLCRRGKSDQRVLTTVKLQVTPPVSESRKRTRETCDDVTNKRQ